MQNTIINIDIKTTATDKGHILTSLFIGINNHITLIAVYINNSNNIQTGIKHNAINLIIPKLKICVIFNKINTATQTIHGITFILYFILIKVIGSIFLIFIFNFSSF
jgi:hypothetical protein